MNILIWGFGIGLINAVMFYLMFYVLGWNSDLFPIYVFISIALYVALAERVTR